MIKDHMFSWYHLPNTPQIVPFHIHLILFAHIFHYWTMFSFPFFLSDLCASVPFFFPFYYTLVVLWLCLLVYFSNSLFTVYVWVYMMTVGTHVTIHVWRSENNFIKMAVSFYLYIPGTDLELPGRWRLIFAILFIDFWLIGLFVVFFLPY